MAKAKQITCPCGSGQVAQQCCARYISGQASAPDALALMRSRYSAYVQGAQDYLQATWHPRTRAELLRDQELACKWTGLKIIRYESQATTATVEFIASYKINGRAQQLHEVSQFEMQDGHWLYVDGQFPDTK